MNQLSLSGTHLKFKTLGNLPITLEESLEQFNKEKPKDANI